MCAGSLVSLGISAWALAGRVENWEYALVFLVSAAGGSVSLYFIRQIPEVRATSEAARRGSTPVPWGAMLRYAPFTRLIVFNLLFMAVLGSLGVFTVEFLRGVVGLDPSSVLLLSGCSFLGALAVLPLLGPAVDRQGSKPALRAAVAGLAAVIGGWFLLSCGALAATTTLIILLNLVAGAASATYNLANVRIAMATMPEMGRNHFFAVFTVVTSLGLGASPVVWGLALDAIGTFEAVTGALVWKRHSFYFFALFLLACLSVFAVRLLRESSPGTTGEDSLVYARLRRWPRIWQR